MQWSLCVAPSMSTGHAPGSLAVTKKQRRVRYLRLKMKLKVEVKKNLVPVATAPKLDTLNMNLCYCQVNSCDYSTLDSIQRTSLHFTLINFNDKLRRKWFSIQLVTRKTSKLEFDSI